MWETVLSLIGLCTELLVKAKNTEHSVLKCKITFTDVMFLHILTNDRAAKMHNSRNRKHLYSELMTNYKQVNNQLVFLSAVK